MPASSQATGEEHVGVKRIVVGEIMDQDLYVAHVIIGIGLPKPDRAVDEDLVMGQDCAYVQ